MSWLPLTWAETAPVADVYERAILTLMAHRAASDGTGAYPSVATVAAYAMCDDSTVKRRLTAMRKRGLVAYGNQALTRHLPRDRRPKVYDLLIPFEWYSAAQLEEVNRARAERGVPPLTPEMRPPISAPGRSRKVRTDKGQPKPRKKPGSPSSEGLFEEPGVLLAPPVGTDAEPDPGGATSLPAGVLVVQDGGATSTPIRNLPSGDTGPVTPRGQAGPRTPASRKRNSPSKVGPDQLGLKTQPLTAREGGSPPTAELELWDVDLLQGERARLIDREGSLSGHALYQVRRRVVAVEQALRSKGVDVRAVGDVTDPQALTLVPPVPRRHRTRNRR